MNIHRTFGSVLIGIALLLGATSMTSPVFAAENGLEQYVGDEPLAFATPEEAAAAFKTALAASDMAGLAKLLGLDEAKLKGFEGISDRVAELQAAAAKLFSVKGDGDLRIVNLGTEV